MVTTSYAMMSLSKVNGIFSDFCKDPAQFRNKKLRDPTLHHAAGLNLGNVIPSPVSSNTTCTGMSIWT